MKPYRAPATPFGDMRLASLFSGGKDSTYAARLAEEAGHEVAYLVSMESEREDSWMFHTANIHLTRLLAKAIGKRHVQAPTSGEKEAELEDLKGTLAGLDIDGVVSGTVASSYQRGRVDRICEELGVEHIAPLWGREGAALLGEMLRVGLVAIFTAVAAMGLDQSWLGRRLDGEAVSDLLSLNRRYGVDPCGEGGEFETLVLYAPWFVGRLEVVRSRVEWDGVRGRLVVEEARLVPAVA